MPSPQLRTLVHRVGSRAVRASQVQVANSNVSWRSFSVSSSEKDRMAVLQADGVMDANGLINFDTLHELRLASCRAFDKNSIFGTYCDAKKDDKDGAFQWMTYHDFNALVDKTRSVLKDIGTCTVVWCGDAARPPALYASYAFLTPYTPHTHTPP